MNLVYPAVFYPDPDSLAFAVTVPDLPGCVSGGDSLASAIAMGEDAASGWILGELEDGNEVPPASDIKDIHPAASPSARISQSPHGSIPSPKQSSSTSQKFCKTRLPLFTRKKHLLLDMICCPPMWRVFLCRYANKPFRASSMRRFATSKYLSSRSIPMNRRSSCTQATPVEPLPMKESRTTSPASV